MAKTSPTQRSLKFLREAGWTVEVVEHWNSYTRTRKDLFGCIDLVALRQGELAGIQTTSGHGSARIAKIKAEPRMVKWLEAGGTLYVHGWAKRGARGKRKLWDCRVIKLTLDDLLEVPDRGHLDARGSAGRVDTLTPDDDVQVLTGVDAQRSVGEIALEASSGNTHSRRRRKDLRA